MNQTKIGEFIAWARRNKNMTQSQLAERLNVSVNAVSKWERGLNLPDVSNMEELCNILGITLNELFSGEKIAEAEIERKSNENILSLVEVQVKSRKRFRNTIVLLFSVVIIFGINLVVFMKSFSVSKTFKYNWNIYLPNNFKEIYHVKSESSFFGDGLRYSVFEGSSFLSLMSDEENEEMEEEVKAMYHSLNVPKEQQFDFEKEYLWVKIVKEDDDRCYMYCIYSSNDSRYYFYEFFV